MSNINPKITEILNQHHIDPNLGKLHLLCLYHNIDDRSISSEEIMKRVNLTKIVERDYEQRENLIWNIPLYEDQPKSEGEWEWVLSWRVLFGELRPDAIGNRKNCLIKMKKYFAEHPSIRQADVAAATNLYLDKFRNNRTQVKYLQMADYFISKVVKAEGGTEYASRLDMYLEILKKNEAEGKRVLDQNRFGRVM